MVRPRFAKLPVAQQQAILQAALDEFAAHGFHDASLNQVIEAAGISKGSMYYYFDGKEDLYAYVIQRELEQLFAHVGPVQIPADADADRYWSALESYYLRLMTALSSSPQLAGLIRGWLNASANPAMQRAQREMESAVTPWMEWAIEVGQSAGAVRTDLPSGLLIAVVSGMGQAMDVWLMTQQPEVQSLPQLIGVFVGMIRGALQP